MVERFHKSLRSGTGLAAALIGIHFGLPVAAAGQQISEAFADFPRLGASLEEVLFVMGPPAGIYLAGQDGEFPEPSVTDAVIMTYERDFLERPAFGWISITNCRVVRISMRFEDPLPVDRLNDRLGAVPRHERRLETSDDAGLKVEIGTEHDPEGRIHVLVYPSLGIEAILHWSGKGVELVTLTKPPGEK